MQINGYRKNIQVIRIKRIEITAILCPIKKWRKVDCSENCLFAPRWINTADFSIELIGWREEGGKKEGNLDQYATRASDYFEIHLTSSTSTPTPTPALTRARMYLLPFDSPAVFRVTGGIGMPARVAGLRIPNEKPSGSCTYPGCTCAVRHAARNGP